jgi:hypothetical protein
VTDAVTLLPYYTHLRYIACLQADLNLGPLHQNGSEKGVMEKFKEYLLSFTSGTTNAAQILP